MRLIVIVVLFHLSTSVYSQNKENGVELTASAKNDNVLLRWAPNDAALWYYANEYGYTIERFTFKRDGELLDIPEKEVLEEDIKPEPLENWQSLALQNDYAAVAAQCIYGESLEIMNGGSSVFNVVNKAKELESRFSFAVLSADQNIEVAKLSGLFYKDLSSKSNEYYLYRVYANVPNEIQKADTAALYFGLEEFEGLPKPQLLDVQTQEQNVVVGWNTIAFDHIYNYYQIERSSDSINFDLLNGIPVINVESGPRKNRKTGIYVDTTASPGTYYYRIRGRNAFGQVSPPSKFLEIEVLPVNTIPSPKIIDGVNVDNKSVRLSVSIPSQESIRDLYIERASAVKGPYSRINTQRISETTILDGNPQQNNYYRLIFENEFHRRESLPYYVQLVDSIAPEPVRISNSLVQDSLVTILWSKSDAEDLAGYRVYKSNFKNSEPYLINTNYLIKDTVFREIIDLENLTKSSYYYVSAIDRVDNQSQLSAPFKIIKADRIPPTLPVFNKIESSKDSVFLEWTKSSSLDVKNYLIYGKQNTRYVLRDVLSASANVFQEYLPITKDSRLTYRIVVIDSAGNEAFTKPISIYHKASKSEVEFQFFQQDKGFVIRWNTEGIRHSKAKVYIKEGDDFNLFKIVDFEAGVVNIVTKVKQENIKVIFI